MYFQKAAWPQKVWYVSFPRLIPDTVARFIPLSATLEPVSYTHLELQSSAPDAVITEGRLLNCGTKQEISEWVNSL